MMQTEDFFKNTDEMASSSSSHRYTHMSASNNNNKKLQTNISILCVIASSFSNKIRKMNERKDSIQTLLGNEHRK